MKHLYNDDDRMISPEGYDLYNKAGDLIRPLFEDYIRQGYSIRDISHIVQGAVNELELSTVVFKHYDSDGVKKS